MEKKYNQFRGALPVLIPVATVFLLAVGGIGWLLFGGKNSDPAPAKGLSPQLTQSWKSTPSDIEGMSKLEKYEAGLSVAAGSDTDGDGLTDKEEIETYGTDPLKASTAGDLYTDGYKVAAGMNPKKKYDYEGRQYFPNNACGEVTLSAKAPLDFNAVVTPCEGISQYMGLKVYAAYRVYNYSGKFSVDLSDVLRREGIKLSDIDIYVSDGAELERYSFSKDGSTATLKKNFSADCTYTVYCAEDNFLKFAVAKAVSSELGGAVTDALGDITDSLTPEEKEEEVTGSGVVMMSPILNAFLKVPILVFCEDLGDDVKNEQLQDAIAHHAVYFLVREEDTSNYVFDTDFYNGFVIQGIYQTLRDKFSPLDVSNIENNDCKWYHFLILYYSYEDRKQFDAGLTDSDDPDDSDNPGGSFEIEKETSRPETDTVSGFHPQWDTLPFGNFKTSFSPDGSCAGIAHLTTYLYNRTTFPAQSSAAPWDSEIQWSLMRDPANATLCDPGLRSYKDENFLTEHTGEDGMIDLTTVSDGEAEFFKMIADTYLAANENAEFICYELFGGDFSTVKQDYAVIEAAKNYLSSGKILTVYLGMVDGSRHAVNIYDYKIDETNPDIVHFSVYDCNYPDNQTGDETLSEAGFTLVVEKKLHKDGNGYTFGYDFFPTSNKNYGATSNPKRSGNNMILILDESGHLLND